MSCNKHNLCMNNTLCKICVDEKLFKEKKQYAKTVKYKERLGSAFEKKVIKKHNTALAKATINSGTFWMDKGDIKTEDFLIEAKDRGSLKQITIHKNWIEKINDEALMIDKIPLLTFQFKQDEKIYAIMNYDDLMFIINRRQSDE